MSELVVPGIGAYSAPAAAGSSVSDIIDRTYSEWLYPAGVNRPSLDVLTEAIDDTTKTLRLEGRVKELGKNSILEIGDELMPVKDRDGVQVTVFERGYRESAAAPHLADSQVRVDPEYTRVALFNALKTVIGMLYTWGVYRREVSTSYVGTTTGLLAMPADAKRILSVRPARSGGRWGGPLQAGFDYDELKDVSGAPELQLHRASGQALRIVYAADFTRPASMATDLSTSEVPETIREGLPIAIAGHLLQGREVNRLDIETVRQLLAAQGAQIPVGATFNVGQALLNAFKQMYVAAEASRLSELDPHSFEYVRA
jgi:hypothetical protein